MAEAEADDDDNEPDEDELELEELGAGGATVKVWPANVVVLPD